MESLFGEFTVDEAVGAYKRDAMRLIDQSYLAELGHVPCDEFDTQAAFFIACVRNSGEVVGAVRMLPPKLQPFDLGSFVDLGSFFPPDRRLALLGRLSVAPEYRRVKKGQVLQLGLLHVACRRAIDLGVTDIVIYTFAELELVYRAVLFRPTGLEFFHPIAKRRMSVLSLDLEALRRKGAQASRTGRVLLGIDSSEVGTLGE